MDWIFLIISVALIIVFVFSFTKGKAPLRYLFYFWIATFHIGPRAISPMGIKIFFSEGFTWLVFFLFLIRSNFYVSSKNVMARHTGLILISCLLGVFMAVLNGQEWGKIIYEVKAFLCLVPVFYITHYGIKSLNVKLDTIVVIFVGGCLVLSLGGVVSYFFPSLIQLLPADLVSGESVLIDTRVVTAEVGEQTLVRGGASFWGLLIISGYLALLLFPIYIQGSLGRRGIKKFFYIGICLAMIVTIILCGHRSVWVGVLAGIAIYSYLKGLKGLSRGAFFLTLVFLLIPETVYLRFISVADQAKWAGRVERYDYALEIIRHNPFFGKGWGAVGWTHNAVLQLGANLGLFGIFAFFVWLKRLFFSSFHAYKKLPDFDPLKPMVLSFLMAIIVYMGPMLGESVITWTFMMIPFWFFCAILHNFYNGNITKWC